ncbi:LiaF domain-containing protein [Aliidiomarina soli]|uniref:Cell wall-active antibiotics response LiaF-like C-terminal domain-containing protein n=1 Tax=Aliidiomarina soli TaxID=1928574 RepID=A0A432WFA9_9GAMM|nr:LiaF domain-containing protein [Aliidiomarina soli]RUO32458.1 hypothetical protein CWE14_09935 [Aliidiomarina soli]
MPVKLEDRPIEQVREETIDKLIVNYSHGIISAEAFERRLDDASNADAHQPLVDLVTDLPLEADNEYERYKDSQFTPNYRAAGERTEERIVSILSSNERDGQWTVPKELHLICGIGSLTLDLTDAVFEHQHVVIQVSNILSSVEIFVPEHVNVSSRITSIISSSENSAPSMGGRQAPTISIEGWSVLGSIEVKVKKTMKEKLVAFANSIKSALNGS